MNLFLVFTLSILTNIAFSKQAITKHTNVNSSNWIPKIIWTWWDKQIAEDNHRLKLFQFNHRVKNKGWQVRHLNYSNQDYWLDQVPDNDGLIYSDYFKDLAAARRSDLVRLMLLKHFGGVYIDLTVMFTQSLDWLFDIHNQPAIENKFGDFPDLLLTHNSNRGSKQYAEDQNGKRVLYRPTYQNSIIVARPKAKFVQLWFQKYVQLRKLSYEKFGNNSTKSIAPEFMKQNKLRRFFYTSSYWQQPLSAQIIMQMKQRQFDEIWKKDKSKPRQFAVKYYKIWTMGTKDTSFLMQQAARFKHSITMQRMFRITIKQAIKIKSHPKYFIKFYSSVRSHWNGYWCNQTSLSNASCPIKRYILQDSIGYHYFLKDYPVKFYSNPVVKKPQDIDCEKIITDIKKNLQNNSNISSNISDIQIKTMKNQKYQNQNTKFQKQNKQFGKIIKQSNLKREYQIQNTNNKKIVQNKQFQKNKNLQPLKINKKIQQQKQKIKSYQNNKTEIIQQSQKKQKQIFGGNKNLASQIKKTIEQKKQQKNKQQYIQKIKQQILQIQKSQKKYKQMLIKEINQSYEKKANELEILYNGKVQKILNTKKQSQPIPKLENQTIQKNFLQKHMFQMIIIIIISLPIMILIYVRKYRTIKNPRKFIPDMQISKIIQSQQKTIQ